MRERRGGPEQRGESWGGETHPMSAQRNAAGPSARASAPTTVAETLRSPGQPLEAGIRSLLEPRFGYDFGQVRVHTDAGAGESAEAVEAKAYAMGNAIVFGAGQFAPTSPGGLSLLAHELAHVVQQSAS